MWTPVKSIHSALPFCCPYQSASSVHLKFYERIYHSSAISLLIENYKSHQKHFTLLCGEQGWRNGESARLPPIRPRFDSPPVPYVGWVCCWFSPCFEEFSPGSRFSSLHKNQHSKFQFEQDKGATWKPAKADGASSLNVVIYLFIYLFIY